MKKMSGTNPMPKIASNKSAGTVPKGKSIPSTSKKGGASMGTPGKKGM